MDQERHIFTVTELNSCVKELVESVPAFGDLLLRGAPPVLTLTAQLGLEQPLCRA